MKDKCKNNSFLNMYIAIFGSIILIIVLVFMSSGITDDKNILTALYDNDETTQIGDVIISFDENYIDIGNAISHEEGSNEININESGVYQISYQLFGTRETIGIFNFNAVLLVNGTALEETLNQGPILFDQVVNRMTLTSTVFLNLNAGDTLQLGGVSVEPVRYPVARIDIEKIY